MFAYKLLITIPEILNQVYSNENHIFADSLALYIYIRIHIFRHLCISIYNCLTVCMPQSILSGLRHLLLQPCKPLTTENLFSSQIVSELPISFSFNVTLNHKHTQKSEWYISLNCTTDNFVWIGL